ncbi:metallophosphoesterase [candidate division KSB1 bacterium]|nr:metallophosphoesterase [candidate division KSB1 bacterium]
MAAIKILFLADTHLGFDLPLKPRIQRRRRGIDFFENYHCALEPALMRQVHLVINGGDMFFRSRVHPRIVNDAFDPLLKIADSGIPVFIVPGNHERSYIPRTLFDTHPNLTIFDVPKTSYLKIGEATLALSGFPYYRKGIRRAFGRVVEATKYSSEGADFRLLCMHQIVEGAQVGVQNYTFRTGEDVIKCADIPNHFDAILSGHIHREQVLQKDLSGRHLGSPVIYPGSIERTSFAERNERKGYGILVLHRKTCDTDSSVRWRFQELPTRPMHSIEIDAGKIITSKIRKIISERILGLDPDSIVQIRLTGERRMEILAELNAAFLRSIAPPSMNIELSILT